MLFEKEFCQENLNESNLPTMEQVRNCVVEEYGSLPGEKIDELAAVLNQGSRDLILQGRHAVGTRELREIVDLVVNKFPPPDAENRVYYENIYAAVIAEFPGLDGKEKVVKLREKHPGFSLVLS
jgi:hypothetical protein